MKVQEAIDMLTRYVGEGGYLNADDEIIVNWWSYDDVLIQDVEMSQDKARVIWSHVFDVLDRCDNIDNDFVRDEITMAIAEYDEANGDLTND